MTLHHDHPGDWTAYAWTFDKAGNSIRRNGYDGIVACIGRVRGRRVRFQVVTVSDSTINAKLCEQRAGSLDEAKHLADTALKQAGFTLKDEP